MTIKTVGQLRDALNAFIAADEYRADMLVLDGDKRPFLSMDVQRDNGLAVLVLDSVGVRIEPRPIGDLIDEDIARASSEGRHYLEPRK